MSATVPGASFTYSVIVLSSFSCSSLCRGYFASSSQPNPGIHEKIDRLHGVAGAAMDGQLDVGRIQAMGPDVAMEDLRSLKGIGPFYSALIVVRGSGFADLPVAEPMALEIVGRLYGLSGPPSEDEFLQMAERWKPFRTWAIVLIRAAGPRLLAASASSPSG